MRRIKAFGMFWYDFIIGDDWRIALSVVAGLIVTYFVAKTSVPAWWILPVVLAIGLPASLVLATRRK
jgi:hypothetical protein